MRPRLITPVSPHLVTSADPTIPSTTTAAEIARIVQEALDDLRTERVRLVDLDLDLEHERQGDDAPATNVDLSARH